MVSLRMSLWGVIIGYLFTRVKALRGLRPLAVALVPLVTWGLQQRKR